MSWSDPLRTDTDGDALKDGDEVHIYGTNPTKADTDDDLLMDGQEISLNLDPKNRDTDNDGLIDGKDPQFVIIYTGDKHALPDDYRQSFKFWAEQLKRRERFGVIMVDEPHEHPEGESDDQTPGDAIAAACAAKGMAYVAIPVTHAGFSEPQVAAMRAALASAEGPVLAYCRSGTRSTLLWALAEASRGEEADELARLAGNAGYDLSPVRGLMDMLAAGK